MKWIIPAIAVAALQIGFVISVVRTPEPTATLDEVVVTVAHHAAPTPPARG